jgi:hypothetical protein
MPQRISTYRLTDYYKKNPKDNTSGLVANARHGFFDGDQSAPYYLMDLGRAEKLLELAQPHVCEEQHLMFLAYPSRDSDMHYTGIFSLNDQRYKLHVFLRNDTEGMPSISWELLDPFERVLLNAQQIFEVVEYAIRESDGALQMLEEVRQSHYKLIDDYESVFSRQHDLYQTVLGKDPEDIASQLACVDRAKVSLEQLMLLDLANGEYHQLRLNHLEVSEQLILSMQECANQEADLVPSFTQKVAVSSSSVVVKQPVSEQLARSREKLRREIQVLWDDIDDAVSSFQEMQALDIPESLVGDNKLLSHHYLDHIVSLEHSYVALRQRYLFMPFSSGVIADEKNKRSTLDKKIKVLEKHHEIVVKKCLQTILMARVPGDKCMDTLKCLATWLPNITQNIFRLVVQRDNVSVLMILLDNHLSLQSEIPVANASSSTFKKTKSILELIIVYKAKACLSEIVKQQLPINLLALGSDGKPLARAIIFLDVLDPFKKQCAEELFTLKMPWFYENLSVILDEQGDEKGAFVAKMEASYYKNKNNFELVSMTADEEEKYKVFLDRPVIKRIIPIARATDFYDVEAKKHLSILRKSHPSIVEKLDPIVQPYLLSNEGDFGDLDKILEMADDIPENMWLTYIPLMVVVKKELHDFLRINVQAIEHGRGSDVGGLEVVMSKQLSEFYLRRFMRADAYLNLPNRKSQVLKDLTQGLTQVKDDIELLAQGGSGKSSRKVKERSAQAVERLNLQAVTLSEKFKKLEVLSEEEELLEYSLSGVVLDALDGMSFLGGDLLAAAAVEETQSVALVSSPSCF